MKWKKTSRRICFALMLVLILPPVLALIAHGIFFDFMTFRSDDYKNGVAIEVAGGAVEEVTFPSMDGKSIAGYWLSPLDTEAKGLIVFAHGYGHGGMRCYLDLIEAFVLRGFAVFSYDVLGTDGSGGVGVQGFPRGVMELDAALDYVKASGRYADLGLYLMGHSWGGYSVSAVLNLRDDVDAVVNFAGFDLPSDITRARGEVFLGPFVYVLSPYMTLYERIKFGDYAELSALEGYKASSCPVMILHGALDETVPPENGYMIFERELGENDRFTFRYFENRDHYNLWYTTPPVLNDALLDEIATFLEAA